MPLCFVPASLACPLLGQRRSKPTGAILLRTACIQPANILRQDARLRNDGPPHVVIFRDRRKGSRGPRRLELIGHDGQ